VKYPFEAAGDPETYQSAGEGREEEKWMFYIWSIEKKTHKTYCIE
jgi:hypothetical protein